MMLRIQQQSGFIELGEFHFDEAGQLFRDGQLDVREVRMKKMLKMLWICMCTCDDCYQIQFVIFTAYTN